MIDIVQALDDPNLFGPWFSGPSWSTWKAVLTSRLAPRVECAMCVACQGKRMACQRRAQCQNGVIVFSSESGWPLADERKFR